MWNWSESDPLTKDLRKPYLLYLITPFEARFLSLLLEKGRIEGEWEEHYWRRKCRGRNRVRQVILWQKDWHSIDLQEHILLSPLEGQLANLMWRQTSNDDVVIFNDIFIIDTLHIRCPDIFNPHSWVSSKPLPHIERPRSINASRIRLSAFVFIPRLRCYGLYTDMSL